MSAVEKLCPRIVRRSTAHAVSISGTPRITSGMKIGAKKKNAWPENSALDCGKFERVFGIETKPWRESLARVIDRLESDAKGAG